MTLELGNIQIKVPIALNLGKAYLNIGNFEVAQKHLENSLQLAQAHDIYLDMIYAHTYLASLFLRKKELNIAIKHIGQAKRLAEDANAMTAMPRSMLIES